MHIACMPLSKGHVCKASSHEKTSMPYFLRASSTEAYLPAHHGITNKPTFKVWQPRRAARSKRPNTPSDGTKTNGAVTHPETEVLPTNSNHLGDLNQLSIRITYNPRIFAKDHLNVQVNESTSVLV
jgi:hypothetical protein